MPTGGEGRSNYLEMVCRQGERGVKPSGDGMPTGGEGCRIS